MSSIGFGSASPLSANLSETASQGAKSRWLKLADGLAAYCSEFDTALRAENEHARLRANAPIERSEVAAQVKELLY